MSFVKLLVLFFLVTIVTANRSYQLSEDVEIVNNGKELQNEARGERSLEDNLLEFIESHDVKLKLPLDTAAEISARNIDDGVINFKLKMGSDQDEGRGAKKRLKKAMLSIAVILAIKAITLVPLILGILGLKTWNAIQLGILTMLFTFGLGVYEMTKKFAADEAPVMLSQPWNMQHRSYDELPIADAQQMAYRAH